jgi:hypothetical protein
MIEIDKSMSTAIEDRTGYLPPSEQEVKEMSVNVALRKVVDDLFTCEAVADKLRGSEDDPQIEALVSHHKQILVEHLEEITWRGIDELLAQLDHLQAQPRLPLSPSPDQRDELDSRTG